MNGDAGALLVRIRVEVLPWLTRAFDSDDGGTLGLRRSISAGTTLAGLLATMAAEYPQFAPLALDTNGNVACLHICLILNDRVAESAEFEQELHDGDVLVLLPAFAGG